MMTGGWTQRAWGIGFAVVAALLVPVYLWLAGLGYGTDTDTYAMLRTWQRITDFGLYRPSRGQGYPLAELAIGFLAAHGGSAAANALSVALGLGAVALGADLLRRLGLAAALPAALFVMANPHWIIAATTSLDYIHGAFFFVLGVWLLARGWLVAAMLALAAAAGSRIVYAPPGFVLLAAAVWLAPAGHRRQRVEVLLAYGVVAVLFYLPALISARFSLDFLHSSGPANNVVLARIGRFVWKSLGLYGHVGAVLLAVALLPRVRRAWRERAEWTARQRRLAAGALGLLAYSTGLFFYLPLEIGYQLPSLLAVAALLALLRVPRPWLAALVASQVALALVRPDFLTPIADPRDCMAPIITTGARFEASLNPGVLITHVRDAARAACALSHLPHPPADPWVALPPPQPRGLVPR